MNPVNKNDRIIIIATSIVLVLILTGEVVTMTSSHDDFSSSITVDGDDVDFKLKTRGSYSYEVLSLEDSLRMPESIAIYHDPAYKSAAEEGGSSTGGMPFTEDYYLKQIKGKFMVRGVENLKVLDAQGLEDFLSQPGSGQALIVISGSLPNNVYTGDVESDPIFGWLNSGGRLYWAGDILGKYISYPDRVDPIDGGTTLFLGSECIDTEEYTADTDIEEEHKEFKKHLHLINHEAQFSVDTAELPSDKRFQSMGRTDGTHATITMVGYGEGIIYVFGGKYSIEQSDDLTQTVASGIGLDTTIKDFKTGKFRGVVEGTVMKADSVYIMIGGDLLVYGQNYEVE